MNSGLIMEILAFIVGMIPIAEKVFKNQPKSGAAKKEMVTVTAKAVAETMEKVSTGGQKDTWGIIGSVIDPFIDLAHRLLGAFGLVNK